MITPVQPSSVPGTSSSTGLETLRGLKGPGTTTSRPLLAQATGGSAVLSKAQVQELNPRWSGTAAQSSTTSMQQVELVGQSLVESGVLKQTAGQPSKLTKDLRLATGLVIPAGTKVSGTGLPPDPREAVNDTGYAVKSLQFELPNGSSITFESGTAAASKLGATNITIVNGGTGATATAQFRAALFLDTKTNALNFVNGPSDGKFRVSDFRTQAAGSSSKAALGAALQKIGLGSL